jgi:hypothetical protein
MSPSAAKTNPDPPAVAASGRVRRPVSVLETSMLTTEGATISTARVTARE